VRKATLFAFAFLIATVCLQAQAVGQAAAKTSKLTTIQGCLSFSNGHYRLTESSGKTWQLSNEVNQLRHHIGHEVELTGMPGERTIDTSQEGAGESTVKEEKVFKVKSVKHLADTCTAPAK